MGRKEAMRRISATAQSNSRILLRSTQKRLKNPRKVFVRRYQRTDVEPFNFPKNEELRLEFLKSGKEFLESSENLKTTFPILSAFRFRHFVSIVAIGFVIYILYFSDRTQRNYDETLPWLKPP